MTVDDILTLKDFELITVKWHGGNGPWPYHVQWFGSIPWAATPKRGLVDPLIGSPSDRVCLHQVERATA